MHYYALIVELSFFPNTDSSLDLKKIKDTEHYKKAIQKDPFLFQMENQFLSKELQGVSYIDITLNFLQLFGSKEIFKKHKSLYDNYFLGAFIQYYFFLQLEEKHIDTFQKNLKSLERESLSIISLTKYIIKERLHIRPEINSLNYLCAIIDENDITDKEKLLFIIIIKMLVSISYHFEDKEKIEIDELKTTSQIKKLLKRIRKSNSTQKYLDIIIKELDLKDKEVLKLTKAIPNKGISPK